MVTEKIGKAYFWRSGAPPPASHFVFRNFLKALLDRRQDDLRRISSLFGFKSTAGFTHWIRNNFRLAREVEFLAPDLDRPNAEYPWPHHAPIAAPATYDSPGWRDLTGKTSEGRRFLNFVGVAVRTFPDYA
jgi:hypothetical protein